MEVLNMISTQTTQNYVYAIGGRTINLDKTMVDEYSDLVCPVDEKYMDYMIRVFAKDGCTDQVLSAKINMDMARELDGYKR